MAEDVVLYEVSDGIAQITLNRPDALNAWTPELGSAYFDRLEEADATSEVRAIIVTGAGRGFCAGADFKHLQAIGHSGDGATRDPRPQTLPTSLRKPVIAAINGACAGLGFVMAVMCDLRFAAASAKFTTAFARRGLIAEYGLSWILPRLIGTGRALDLLLSGRTFLGEEAHALGLVERLTDPDRVVGEARTYAAELVTCSSPASMATIKHQVYDDLVQSLQDGAVAADDYMRESFARRDFQEGVDSFVERRNPAFEPLGTMH
jgi:enoyl-CoA hydratase/carnithine racemase